ncbi:hypothetical protein EV368DRAFT_66952 [Lentinula lateritia]|uniref:Uncharacterized protein n=1 Tax=Lentinula aff. lateritia TaxID=2804960 RepID=A0ACC1TRN8_9AGAR|nr:hypothetical protein F5876DRAFT_68127 [Lentinula aff. lateritia]KAJ3850017.1 hypothetical protein EV368DRAFT_66952 [Lentinula lateritia]
MVHSRIVLITFLTVGTVSVLSAPVLDLPSAPVVTRGIDKNWPPNPPPEQQYGDGDVAYDTKDSAKTPKAQVTLARLISKTHELWATSQRNGSISQSLLKIETELNEHGSSLTTSRMAAMEFQLDTIELQLHNDERLRKSSQQSEQKRVRSVTDGRIFNDLTFLRLTLDDDEEQILAIKRDSRVLGALQGLGVGRTLYPRELLCVGSSLYDHRDFFVASFKYSPSGSIVEFTEARVVPLGYSEFHSLAVTTCYDLT